MSSIQVVGQKRKHPEGGIQPNTPFLFDLLPDDALTIIIRHVSSRPYGKDWQDYIDPIHLLIVLKIGGRLDVLARNVVTQLGSNLEVHSHDKPDIDAEVFQELASQLYSLRLWWDPLPKNAHQFDTLRLRTLNIDCRHMSSKEFPFEAVLRACGDSLRTLEINLLAYCGLSEFGPIARYCKQLKSLRISADGFDEADISPLWSTVGKSLTKLDVHADFPFSAKFTATIAKHCQNVEEIDFNLPLHAWFLKQLGPQLKVIHFRRHWPKPEELIDLFESHRNVKVHADLEDISVEEWLPVLANHLCTLKTQCCELPRSLEFPHLKDVTLEIFDGETSFIKTLFAIPRPNLRQLSVMNLESGKILDTIAESAKCLQVIELHLTYKFSFDNEVCDALLLANPKLRKLYTRYWISDEKFDVKIERFTIAQLKCVKYCKNLVLFEVSGVMEKKLSVGIDNVCVALRTRQMVVDIGGVRYLPA